MGVTLDNHNTIQGFLDQDMTPDAIRELGYNEKRLPSRTLAPTLVPDIPAGPSEAPSADTPPSERPKLTPVVDSTTTPAELTLTAAAEHAYDNGTMTSYMALIASGYTPEQIAKHNAKPIK